MRTIESLGSNVFFVTDTPARPARRIKAGTVRLAFRAWTAAPAPGARPEPGSPASSPLVLLHALGEDSSAWARVAAGLAPPWRVYAPDLRGHGDSERSGPYTVDQLADDLEAFLDALGLRRVALAGHSAGAVPAWLFAARHPERVTRLVLEDPAPPFPGAARDEGSHSGCAPEALALNDEFTAPPDAWRTALSDLKVPTLLIAGGQADAGRLPEMAALIPDCELVTIPAGHLAHACAPEAFTAAVTAFLGQR